MQYYPSYPSKEQIMQNYMANNPFKELKDITEEDCIRRFTNIFQGIFKGIEDRDESYESFVSNCIRASTATLNGDFAHERYPNLEFGVIFYVKDDKLNASLVFGELCCGRYKDDKEMRAKIERFKEIGREKFIDNDDLKKFSFIKVI